MGGKKNLQKTTTPRSSKWKKVFFSSNFEDLRFSDIVGWFARIF
jgi:hypothetical protein